MSAPDKTLEEYLKELEAKKGEKPDQVKEGMEIYLDLWRKAIQRGVVESSDGLEKALEKVDRLGGLYKASGD